MPIRILIVDDHELVRSGLRELLEREPDIEVVGETGDRNTTLTMVDELMPDTVIMDIVMPDINGIEVTRHILAKHETAEVLALSVYSNKHLALGMLRAGASGYLLKECAFEGLVKAIRMISEGRTYLSPQIVDVLIKGHFRHLEESSPPPVSTLTARQRQVFHLLIEGRSTREMSGILSLSTKTIETHRKHLMAKLDIHTIPELIRYALCRVLPN